MMLKGNKIMKFDNTKPIYLQIIDLIFEKILQKKWESDARIPAIRDFSLELEVNPNTVAKAYIECLNLGIIYNKRGVGYFLYKDAYTKTLEIKKKIFLEDEIPQIIKKLNMLNISIDEFILFLIKNSNYKGDKDEK